MQPKWLDNPSFTFDASKYVQAGYEQAPGDFSDSERQLFDKIRSALPELKTWGDLPTGIALGDYFQNVYLVSWLELTDSQLYRENLIEFLAFLYYQQTIGEWPWGHDIEKLHEMLDTARQKKA